jgi:hypothetical protein
MNDPDLAESRSAKVALAVVRYLPIDDLASLVAAYEQLWIPPILYCVERWYRRLNNRLDQRIVDTFRLYGIGGQSVPASIEDVRITTDITTDNGLLLSMTVIAQQTATRYKIVNFCMNDPDDDDDVYVECDDGNPTGVRFYVSVFHQRVRRRP